MSDLEVSGEYSDEKTENMLKTIDVSNIGLSAGACRLLRRNGVFTLYDLIKLDVRDYALKIYKKECAKEITTKMAEYGLYFEYSGDRTFLPFVLSDNRLLKTNNSRIDIEKLMESYKSLSPLEVHLNEILRRAINNRRIPRFLDSYGRGWQAVSALKLKRIVPGGDEAGCWEAFDNRDEVYATENDKDYPASSLIREIAEEKVGSIFSSLDRFGENSDIMLGFLKDLLAIYDVSEKTIEMIQREALLRDIFGEKDQDTSKENPSYTGLQELKVSDVTIQKLQNAGIQSIEDIAKLSLIELEQIPGLGKAGVYEVLDRLEEQGIQLIEKTDDSADTSEMEEPEKRMVITVDTEIFDFYEPTVRGFSCLKRAGVKTVGDLSKLTEEKIDEVRGLREYYDDIVEQLKKEGVSLKDLAEKIPEEREKEEQSEVEEKTEDSEPADVAAFSKLQKELDSILDGLTERERKVLELRFGLIDGKVRTLEEVANVFGVTRERIRQIEAKALRRLRHPSRSKGHKDYLD